MFSFYNLEMVHSLFLQFFIGPHSFLKKEKDLLTKTVKMLAGPFQNRNFVNFQTVTNFYKGYPLFGGMSSIN
jgi:hypothetical protein